MATTTGPALDATLTDAAVDLADRWVVATAGGQTRAERRTTGRLAALVADPAGLELAVRFVDRVARPEDLGVAARELGALARTASAARGFLGPADLALLRVGAVVAPVLPRFVVPAARLRLRQLVGHLVADAGQGLGRHIAAARADGFRLNLNLLGEAVLGEAEATARLERITALVRRPDVDYVSVKVSAVASQLSAWDTAGSRDRVVERLRPLYRTAAAHGTFLNLDMEEYRDLELTLGVFERLVLDPDLLGAEAGIVLQAYLPDSLPALDRLTDLAARRRAAGGARIKVRLVKGANLAMEQVEAQLHGWPQAPLPTKADVDAHYVRLLDRALRPERTRDVRIGVASHNLFHVALAHLLAERRGVGEAVDVEMLQGMAPAQARAVRDTVGDVLLYTPVVARADFDVAISYLVRRLEENAAPQNYLHALFAPSEDVVPSPAPGAAPARDPVAPAVGDVGRSATAGIDAGGSGAGGSSVGGSEASAGGGVGHGLDAQRAAFRAAVRDSGRPPPAPRRTPRPDPVEPVAGEPFRNTPDTDPAVAASRTWADAVVHRTVDVAPVPVVRTPAEVDAAVARALAVAPAWAATEPGTRAAMLRRAAVRLEEVRGDLVATMVAEAGKTVGEADPEVSEAVDFARYYAERAADLADGHVPGARFHPEGLTVVTPPWNFPVAIPVGSVLAALGAGSPVLAKPAPPTPRCLAVAAAAIQRAMDDVGVPRDVLQVLQAPEDDVGRRLVTHPAVARVLLTGSIETARLFSGWRPDLEVLAETSGKNALVVTPSADLDLAVADAVRSAFGHAGQKCSAASLLVLVGSVGRSPRFARQLVDAVRSLRTGWPTDLATTVGPLTEPASGKLLRALTVLEPGERWVVRPRRLDDDGRLWTPGVKDGVAPGSWFHHTEVFGPVLGIMRADSLDEALDLQNAVAFGLTGGLHSLDEAEIERWLARVQVGNAYVNRHITGAVVQRQPFGGWKASVVGPGAKAGGPHYVAGLGRWSDGPDVPADDDGWLAWADADDARWWAERGAVEHDPSGLTVESNVLRYRPVDALTVRVGSGAREREVTRVLRAAARAGVPVRVSRAPGVAGVDAAVEEDDAAFAARVRDGEVRGRIRVVGPVGGLRAAARTRVGEVTVLDAPVLASAEREMLTVVREQSVSRTLHRFGHLPPG